MKRFYLAVAACAIVVACAEGDGTNPFQTGNTGGSTGGSTNTGTLTVPTEVKGDLEAIYYDAAADTVVVEGLTLDEEPYDATYVRRADLDAKYAGYKVFMAQDDPLDRHSTALVLQSTGTKAEGRVRAGIAVVGGVRNRVFGGGYYERDGNYDPAPTGPDAGLVSYSGTYAGLTNIGTRSSDILPVAAGTPTELTPTRSVEMTGDAYVSADFNDNQIEGNIYNRVLHTSTPLAMPSLVLVATAIAEDGSFTGTSVEYEGLVGKDIGDYGGVFGGTESSGVAGAVKLTEFDGEGNPYYDNEIEWGVFVLNRCTAADTTGPCAQVKK